MRLQTKLMALPLIPIVFFMTGAGINISDAHKARQTIKMTTINGGLLKAISELIHQLQQERGLSVLFISGGMEMEALKEQRKNTNKTIPGFQYHLIASTLPDELKKEGTAMANTLQRVRGKTDGSASEGEIKHAYTGLIRTSMELQGAVSRAKTAKGFGRRFVPGCRQ